MLVCAMMMGAGVAQTESRIYVDPPLISNEDLSMGLFTVSINVENVADLYTFAFELHYIKYISVLSVVRVAEGDFFNHLPQPEPYDPAEFDFNIRDFAGVVAVGFTLRGDYPGVSGDGTLALIQFEVLEAGESPLSLENVRLLNSEGKSIRDGIEHGYYEGPVVNLIRGRLGPRKQTVGGTQTFDVKVVNEGDVPLWAKAEIESIRVGDGNIFTFHSGQTFETLPPKDDALLYVDGFVPVVVGWNTYGAAPYLDAIEDGNYIEATSDGAMIAWFTFEDITLGPEDVVSSVILEGYCNGPSNDDVDYDIYAGDFTWLGSLYGRNEPFWVSPRWIGASLSDVYPAALTEAGLNNMVMLVYYYDPDGYATSDIIDCLRMRVQFAPYLISPGVTPEYLIQPGQEMEFDTAMWTPLKAWDVGTYAVSVTIFSTYNGYSCVPGTIVQTRTWWVKPL
jgi:hypothetical protein